MFRQTLTQIKYTSNLLPDPQRAERAMYNFLSCSVKLCKKVLRKDMLTKLKKLGIGTNEVEQCVYRLSKSSTRKVRDVELVKLIMARKLLDAEYDIKKGRVDYRRSEIEYKKCVPEMSDANFSYRYIRRREVEKTWREGKLKNRSKVNTLVHRYRRMEVYTAIRSIMYSDHDLRQIETENTDGNEPRVYGGVQIGTEEMKVLRRDPKYMTMKPIKDVEVEVEIERRDGKQDMK